MAMSSKLAHIVYDFTAREINAEIQVSLSEMRLYADYANERSFESEADLFERFMAAREMEAEVRTEVCERLTPLHTVEIPGLDVSVPVYA